MIDKEREGYEWTKGAVMCIADAFVLAMLITLVYRLAWPMDDSDESRWHRSGLTIHRDAKTGIEYLSDGHGGMVRRGDYTVTTSETTP